MIKIWVVKEMIFYKNKWSILSIIMYWIFSIIMILNYIHYHLSTGHFGGAEGGIPLFYEIIFSANQIMDAVYGFVAFMIPPLFFSHECIRQRITHCDYLQSVRLQHKKTFFSPLLSKQFKTNFIIIYFVFLVKMFLQAILVHLFYSPFIFEESSSYLTWSFKINFSTNSFINLICTIVIIPLGYAIFYSFVFSVGLFLKRYIIYLCSGLLLVIISLLLAMIIGGISPIIGYSICVLSLIQPGMYTLLGETISHSAWVIFVYPAIFYSLLTILLLIIRRKMDLKEGY